MDSAIGRPRFPSWTQVTAAAGRFGLSALFVAGMTAPALSHAAPAAAQEGPLTFSTAEAAPADAVTYVVTTLDDRSEQWRLADTLLDRAGLGEAIDKAVASGLQDEAGQDLPLDAFLGGEVAVIVTQTALDTLAEESMGGGDFESMLSDLGMATPEAEVTGPQPQGFAVVLDARAPDTAWAGIREAAQDGNPEEETYAGTTIIYEPPSSDSEEGSAAAKVGDHILLAMAPADLYPVIDTLGGTTPNITTVPQFSTAQDALPKDVLTFSFSNSLADMDVDLGPLGPGLEGLISDSYAASTIAADEPGFRIETVAIPGDEATATTGGAPFESQLVNQAPDDALLFMSAADLGDTGVLDAIGALLLGLAFGMGDTSMMEPGTPEANVSPEDAIAKQYEDAAALLGVNLQTDLFQQFEGEYGGWLSANMDSQAVSGLFASHVGDPDTVANALMQLSFLIQGATGSDAPLTTRQVGGGQVYVIDLGDGSGATLEFGVVGDQFVIGESKAIDRLSGDTGENLASNAQFQAVMDALPAEGNGTFYIDLAQAVPLIEAASEEADSFNFDTPGQITDASDSCANYASQEDAQAAYDAAEPDTFDLDQDFDGQVCEDFFAPTTSDDETADGGSDEIEEAFANADLSAIKAFATVSHNEDGMERTSSILYIAE